MTSLDTQTQKSEGAKAYSSNASAPLRPGVSLSQTTWIAAGFILVVAVAMLHQHYTAAERDPWKSPQLLALKEKLRAAPTDESLRNEIRRLDLEFRQRYFRRLALNVMGGWLLVGGAVVLLFAAKNSWRLLQPPPMPPRRGSIGTIPPPGVSPSRWSVVGVGALVGTGLVALALTGSSLLPERPEDLDK